jgi:hypothetical protein
VKRNSIILPNIYIENVKLSDPYINAENIEIRIDEKNALEILEFINKNRKKFARILREVLLGSYYDDLYSREPPKGKNVTAMKFKGKQNIRIICKEMFCDSKKVVMVTLFHKKSSKGSNISKKDLALYTAIGEYEYEC